MNTGLECWRNTEWSNLLQSCSKTQEYLLNTILNIKYEIERYRNHSLIRSMSARLKAMDSLKAKLVRLGYEVTPENAAFVLHDIVGIRIICSYLNDIETVIDLLKKMDHFQITEIKDYVRHPKPSGYRSVHVIGICDSSGRPVQCEIQLRTTAMDSWAALEHQMRYKKDLPESEFVNQELFKCAQLLFETDCRMQRIHSFVHDQRTSPANTARQKAAEMADSICPCSKQETETPDLTDTDADGAEIASEELDSAETADSADTLLI